MSEKASKSAKKSRLIVGISGASGTAYPNYDVWDGTSMATPMVAGIAGLV